ncbi:hypothetical protein D6D17_03237 [Aureobasidium pullulans]|uniref:Ubiquitin-like-conjugating enzyme ATG10 n=1 Tax=Aureobasidium pullulans TaxID=5580 RepID=A0A4S8VVY1_AURPU|nr:hypothetical protein D6D24_04343 [Aureobasidium pullulans]THW42765.1 hypothetical protein D6D22_04792 [Aureobasidium pullulans]THX14437.1 hypothetical protein D6D17_03237 [Aureobasidium pullulans]THZ18313.1 hypothetical protein D6C89_08340 [Aureobasidium pullulans]
MVSAFPYLTEDEFVKACEEVQDRLPDSALFAGESSCLRITRRLASACVADADHQEQLETHVEAFEADDEEAIVKQPQSETYRVPVVYMTASPPLPVSHFLDLVVPHHFQDAVRETGVMGALSMTVIAYAAEPASRADLYWQDHPNTGMPAYFVHPCRTADTMCATGAAGVQIQDYMLVWLGIIGASVGLNVSSTDLRRA